MKKSFQKTLIAASAGVAMFAAVGTASANSLLFPYFTTASGAQSVLSLVNTGLVGTTSTPVHYVYNYGTDCTHYDATGSLTPNDTLSHSIASPAAGGFGLAIGNDKSVPVYFPEANKTGFLVVSTAGAGAGATPALRGSMAIIDPATGLVVSYPGIDGTGNTEGNFTNVVGSAFALTALPSAFVTTSWYGVITGDMSGAIRDGANWDATATFTNNGNVFNNDEVAYSGTKTKTLKCAGSITPGDLLTSAQAAAVGPNGGLVKTTAAFAGAGGAGPVYQGTGVVLMKMQAIQPATGGVFVGKQFLHQEQAGFVASAAVPVVAVP